LIFVLGQVSHSTHSMSVICPNHPFSIYPFFHHQLYPRHPHERGQTKIEENPTSIPQVLQVHSNFC
jgi:hypothetical protein